VGRLTIYKHSTQDRYHLVTTFRLECDYEEICERDRQTNMNGFLFQQHRPIFLPNPDSYHSTPSDIKTSQPSQRPLHPAVHLHVNGSLHLFFGRPNLFYRQECVPALTSKYVRASLMLNPLTPNGPYRGRTAPLTSKRCILYIHSTNIGTEYFKHGIYSSFFSLKNAVCFIILISLVPVLFTFYIHCVLKLKKK